MGAGEGGVSQTSRPRVARVNGDLVAVFHHLHHPVHLLEAKLRVDALAVEVHRQSHQTDVAGAFAVAKQAAFYPIAPAITASSALATPVRDRYAGVR